MIGIEPMCAALRAAPSTTRAHGRAKNVGCPARNSNPESPDQESGALTDSASKACAPLPGLEPGTSAFVARRSLQLGYRGLEW